MKNTLKSTLAGLALAAAIGGGALATTALPANAASTDSSQSGSSQSTAQAQPRDESKGGHQANGITETLLTGDTATKVTDAALAANPGATIQRVENDAEGAVHEAHIITADGTRATVYLDASFTVTSTEIGGPGGGMKG